MGRHAYKVPFDAGKREIRSMNYFEQQHCLLSQEACTLATTPKKVGIGGCKLPAEDDRVLAAFKTDVVSMRSSSIQREKQQHTA